MTKPLRSDASTLPLKYLVLGGRMVYSRLGYDERGS